MNPVFRLPLENAYNVRELGGYGAYQKEVTKFHRFLRGDGLNKLSECDIQYLKDYGVKVILDLRSEKERQDFPDATLHTPGIETIQIPFMSGEIDDVTKAFDVAKSFKLGDFYLQLLKDKDLVRKVMSSVADAPQGCLLFHCSAGKDRTGILSMLLLSLVGVSREDIIANYQVTYTYLKANKNLFSSIPKDMDMSCMFSDAENMQKCLDYIKDYYGDTQAYLLACGITKQQIDYLQERLLKD